MSLTLFPPQELRLDVKLPASKSISNRALIIYALATSEGVLKGDFQEKLQNLSDCDDTRVMLRALTEMPEEIDIMAAGTAMRFLTAYLSVTSGTHVITGTERMRHRPIGILVDALRVLGAQVEYVAEEGFPPLRITGGHHRGGKLCLRGDVSSQYISALLMIGPVLEEGLTLTLTGEVISRPYIEMTLQIMRHFGARASWTAGDTLTVLPGGYKSVPYYVESDWSASSYWYEMMALTSDEAPTVQMPGLFKNSLQGDCAVSGFFRHLGIETTFVRDASGVEGVRLTRVGKSVDYLSLDLLNQPDLAQTLVVCCALMGVPFRFSGLQSLKIKETDRIAALRAELAKLGYLIQEADESVLFWNGERCDAQENPQMETYEDHRMAMSLAPACMKTGSIRIQHPGVVSKSYPTFWQSLHGFGMKSDNENS